MKEVIVDSVAKQGQNIIASFTVDGERQNFIFPEDTLEWRAAEYDLDPDDTDTLLEVVWYELFLGELGEYGKHLYECGTLAEARTAHLDRIARVKQLVRIVPTPDAVEQIKAASVIDREIVTNKRNLVQAVQRGQTNKGADRVGLSVAKDTHEQRRAKWARYTR